MRICARCRKETMDATVGTCEGEAEVRYPDGMVLPSVAYDPRTLHFPGWFRCPDCNVAPGARHHANCDQEICPRCKGQLISCSCFDPPE